MNKVTVLCLCMLFSVPAFSQNALQDAKTIIKLQKRLELRESKINEETDTIAAILKKYIPNNSDIKTVDSLKKRYSYSNYISSLLENKTQQEINITTVKNSIAEKRNNLTAEDKKIVKRIKESLEKIENLKFLASDAFVKFKTLDNKLPDSIRTDVVNTAYQKLGQKYTLPKIDTIPLPKRIELLQEKLATEGNIYIETQKIISAYKSSKTLSEKKLAIIDLVNIKNDVTIINKNKSQEILEKNYTQQEAVSKMALPSQSELIDAMAVYLVNRVKTESALAFIDLIRNKLKSDSILINLFPATRELLSNFSTYESPNFGLAWRHAFATDLITIPDKLATDENLAKYTQEQLGPGGKKYYIFFKMAVKLASMSRDNANFIDIIEYLNQDLTDKDDYVLSNYIRFLYMINNEFYVNGKETYWINYSEFNQISPDEFRVLVALLKQKYYRVFDNLEIDLSNTGIANTPSIAEFKTWMSRIFFVINQYQVAIQNKDVNFKDKVHDVSSYWTLINDSFHQFTNREAGKFVLGIDKSFTPTLSIAKYMAYLDKINTTYKDLSGLYNALEDKNYPHVLETVLDLVKELENPETRNRKIFAQAFLQNKYYKYKDFVTWSNDIDHQNFYKSIKKFQEDHDADAPEKTISNDLIMVNNSLKDILKNDDYKKSFSVAFVKNGTTYLDGFCKNYALYRYHYYDTQYGNFIKVTTFINDVMVTKTSDDLSKVVTSYASPPQSYRVKRSSRFSIDLNAYVGVTAGFESFDHPKIAYGLTAPIGVAFSWGLAERKNKVIKTAQPIINPDGQISYLKGNSFSIALTIIDIGAVVRYRFSNDSSEGLPHEVNISQFLSPSVQLHWGIKNTPLDVVVAYQYLPNLRKLGNEDIPAAPKTFKSVSAIYAGLVFDLPLYNFKH